MADKIIGCAYRGDGLQGFGKFLQGLAATHLRETTYYGRKIDTTEHNENKTEENETTSHLVGDELDCLKQYIAEACDDYVNHIYEKSDAINDVQKAIARIFKDYEQEDLPIIYNKECSHGIYNDTTTQLLIDNAYALTVNKAATLELDTIHRYVEHIKTFADILYNALSLAIQNFTSRSLNSQTTTDATRNEVWRGKDVMERELNLENFAIDVAAILIGLTILNAFVDRPPACGED